jgi:membrane magnesium transporter 1
LHVTHSFTDFIGKFSTYSSYEHSLLSPTKVPVASSSAGAKPDSATLDVYSLPPDIIIETLFSTGLLLLGIVLGSPRLRPIEWAAWAGEIEQDNRRPSGKKRFEGDGGAEGGGFAWLEDRKGFWDVRVSRPRL